MRGCRGKDVTTVQTEIDKELCQFGHAPDTKDGGHVRFEYAFDHAFTQDSLGQGQVLGTCLQRVRGFGGRSTQIWRLIADLAEFIEIECGHGHGGPAAHTAFTEFVFMADHGRARGNDAVLRMVVHELLELQVPI